MTRLTGRDVNTGSGIAVEMADGRIAAIAPADDADDCWLAPGLVDLQVNGYGGIDLNDGAVSTESVKALAQLLLAQGTTCFFPTLITASESRITAALMAIVSAIERHALVAEMVGGIHVEGPFISPADGPRGAHPREHVRKPDIAEFERWQAAAKGRIALVTLSPHWPEAPEFIRHVSGQGVTVSIGHTDATSAAVRAAVAAGATLSTHLGNGAAAVLPRHPNFIWTQLADDRLTACFIADGHHLPADTLKAMVRAKGIERSVLVSDVAALGGMPAGIYDQPIGGRVEIDENGRLGVAGTPYLAGAGRLLAEDVAMAANIEGIGLAAAMRMATENAGRFAGGRARLAVGERADLIRFRYSEGDRRLSIEEVWLGGRKRTP
jgi:N-acetylglucosamine-6-phosphate deacetylase